MDSLNSTVELKTSLELPRKQKLSLKRDIKTSLQNDYMKSLILNTGIEFRMCKRVEQKVDCRNCEKGKVSGCPLNKETTFRSEYRFELPMQ